VVEDVTAEELLERALVAALDEPDEFDRFSACQNVVGWYENEIVL